MKTPLILCATILSLTAGCDTVARFNPLNLFDRGTPATRLTVGDTAAPAADPRPLVDQLVSLKIDPTPGGAIVRAVGLPPVQGFWDGELVPVTPAPPGLLAFEFRIVPPAEPTRQSTQASREVVVGQFVSDQALVGIDEIRVTAQRNALGARR